MVSTLGLSNTLAQITPKTTYFNGTWTCLDSTNISVKGYLPGSLHSALIRGGIIEDPFVGTNEQEIQWVNEKNWVFTSDPFDIPEGEWANLKAEGIQLYTTWKLNGRDLGQTNSAFTPHYFDIRNGLKSEENILEVHFSKISTEDRTVHRMPQFVFGWDWGPTLVDRSVKSLTLVGPDTALRNTNLVTNSIHGNQANGMIQWDYEGRGDETVVWAISDDGGKVVARGRESATRGSALFSLDNAKLWWTHDMGTPYLYKLELVVITPGEGMTDRQIQNVGLRTIELDTDNGAFRFILNGKNIYAKGANYIPTDVISTRSNKLEDTHLLESAIAANMNMIRVWGGGSYASDNMMEFCDTKGLLVWHDFMFACAMYPGSDEFLSSVSKEAKAQTLRLRHHPSLALWCGNNEISEGWANWGWQDNLSNSEKESKKQAYKTVFNDILPNIVSENTNTPYWESSPMLGRGDENFINTGDAHDWGLWHDGYSFDSLWTRVPRFMSEFGFQSFPVNHTLRTVISDPSVLKKADYRKNPEIINHEKHPRGFDIIDSYIEMTHRGLTNRSTNLDKWSYLSRVIQAEGVSDVAIAGRVNMGHCWGSLVWQLNDCWPVASWSSIDARGNWKLLHHKLKKAFAPDLLHGRISGNSIDIYLVSDRMSNGLKTKGQLTVDLFDLKGFKINSFTETMELVSGDVSSLHLEKIIPNKVNRNNAFVVLTFKAGSIELTDYVYFVTPGELNLEPTEITVNNLGKVGSRYRIKVTSSKFAKSVELTAEVDGIFSDNGFDLLPGETKIIDFTPHSGDLYVLSTNAPNTGYKPQPNFRARSLVSLSND